ncbi:MAG TPA: DUF4838 domain-containing protein [Candidatus Aminicenantes bacterium]|nr:DUF4838 domain-containing protein [Candidatus Aminicenantes bacterium]HRY65291.1 DUF4838 domain-containing protein [Candidatus Aminicenantes bacterium]HRZ72241.1 DUF4838 domain-containing protein [Candidatus Aminicenantes bacterium]
MSILPRSGRRTGPIVLPLLLISAALGTRPLSASVDIARHGRARARIVVAAGAPETERFAAEELALFLHIVTGASFPVTGDAGRPGGRLLVGPGAAAWAAAEPDAADLAPEEIVVRTVGGDLVLAGGGPRGTLYAVYQFLEDVVGCRWWTSTASRMPRRPSLTVGTVSIRFKPPLEYREPYWYVAFDPVWAARNKGNGIQVGGDAGRGGRQAYEGFVHTFYRLIPPDRYFARHPEWFSEIDGRRTSENAQLCLANEDLRRELVRNLKERLRDNPAATIASVSQNDCAGNCTCPKCRAIDEEEGGPAGSLLRFVNAVAADIEGEFPGVAIDTLAYQYTRRPPRLARPRPNVIVRLCSIECSFAKPLDDPANKAFFDDLEGWSKIAGRLYIWDYTTNFAHYVQPHPNYGVLAANIRLFVARNVRGVFEQGAYQSWGSEMAEMRAWMLAKLLWDPRLDGRRLRDEFLDGYYGPAAGPMRDYLEGLERALAGSGDPLGCYSPSEAKFLSLDTLIRSREALQAAGRKAARSAEYARRVNRASLPLTYAVLACWDALREEARRAGKRWPWPETRQALLARFLEAAGRENVTMISEWQTLADWAAKGGRTK